MPGLPVRARAHHPPLSFRGEGRGEGPSASPLRRSRQAGGFPLSLSPQGARGPGLAPAVLAPAFLLAGCAATQAATTVQADAPGFLLGLWHGFIFPVAFFLSLFMKNVAVYAVPNDGALYNLGYFVGIVFFGVGARKTTKEVVRETVVHDMRDVTPRGEGERP